MRKIKKIKTYSFTLLMLSPLSVFAAYGNGGKTDDRVEVDYNQRHSTLISSEMYADGIKIKRDLSLIDKAQERRALDSDEIPSDDLYGGIWNNQLVDPYKEMESVPDTFRIDLTNFSMPTMGHVTSNFGWRKRFRRVHYGIDLKVQVGDTIYAAFDGKVRLCDYGKGYGYHVVLRHPNGLETVYGHLSKFLVSDDDVVKSGEPIALGGNTGRSTGSHLHFELRFMGKAIDPTAMIDFVNKVTNRDYYKITPNTFNYAFSTRVSASKYYASKRSSGSNKYVSGIVKYHRVKQGDSLYAIARKYGVSLQKLCAMNSITTKSKLSVGKAIRVS